MAYFVGQIFGGIIPVYLISRFFFWIYQKLNKKFASSNNSYSKERFLSFVLGIITCIALGAINFGIVGGLVAYAPGGVIALFIDFLSVRIKKRAV